MICRCEENCLVFEGDNIPSDGVYVFTRKNANSYALFTQKQFSDFSEKLKSADKTDDERIKYVMRFIFGSAIEVKMENGSFYLPPAFELTEILKTEVSGECIEIICEKRISIP